MSVQLLLGNRKIRQNIFYVHAQIEPCVLAMQLDYTQRLHFYGFISITLNVDPENAFRMPRSDIFFQRNNQIFLTVLEITLFALILMSHVLHQIPQSYLTHIDAFKNLLRQSFKRCWVEEVKEHFFVNDQLDAGRICKFRSFFKRAAFWCLNRYMFWDASL